MTTHTVEELSLISPFVVRFLLSIMAKLATGEISNFRSVSLTVTNTGRMRRGGGKDCAFIIEITQRLKQQCFWL